MEKKKNIRKWLYNIAILFFLGVMIFAACNLIPLLIQDHQDNETRKEWDSMVLKKQDQEEQDGTEEEESSEPVDASIRTGRPCRAPTRISWAGSTSRIP